MNYKYFKCNKLIGTALFFFTLSKALLVLGDENFKTSRLGIGLGYSAREICSCMFIENRSLADCREDYLLKTRLISLAVDIKAKEVKVSFLIPEVEKQIFVRTAKIKESSCILLPQ